MADEVVISLDDTERFLVIRNKKLYIETRNRGVTEEGRNEAGAQID
jgi:hypothetical protein